MIYVFLVCTFVAVIYSLPSPLGILVNDDIIEVFNHKVSEVKLDDFEEYADNILEKFMVDRMIESNITANIPSMKNPSNSIQNLDDVHVKDIIKASKN